MTATDQWRRLAIVGGATSTLLSIALGVLTTLDLIGPIWVVIVLPLFLIGVFGGWGTYLIVRYAQREDRGPDPSSRHGSAPAT